MSDGVLSTSGSSLSSQVLSTQQQVLVQKKQQDVAKLEGEAQLRRKLYRPVCGYSVLPNSGASQVVYYPDNCYRDVFLLLYLRPNFP